MSTMINGSTGVTFADASVLGSALGIFNRVINGGFIFNQRVYVSGTSLSAGTYAHDRWKAGSGGCTYTFTRGSLGVNTTITITAGSLQQVIEGCNMQEGGTYVLTWTGTAQGRWNGGTYAASPLVVTGLTAGANATIEFNTGSLGSVQVLSGSAPSSYAYRPYGTELQLCQRYYQAYYGAVGGLLLFGRNYAVGAGQTFPIAIPIKVSFRASPTGTITGTWATNNAAQPVVNTTTTESVGIVFDSSASGDCFAYSNSTSVGVTFSAEL